MQKLAAHGMQTVCCIPLVTRKGPFRKYEFWQQRCVSVFHKDQGLLKQIAAQLAIAVDNTRAYNEISRLNDILAEEKVYLRGEIRSELYFEEIVGESAALKQVLEQAKTVATSNATVLIQGEPVPGKN